MPKAPLLWSLQIKNILCPVDFSEFSVTARTIATCIARHFRSSLFLQHTVHIAAGSYLVGWEPFVIQETIQSELRRAGAELRRLAAVARLDLPEVLMNVGAGNTPERILQSIHKDNIDLVVMGTHGRKGFNRLVMGSVTERIVHEAPCPVLAICRPVRDFIAPNEPEPVDLKTILLATDFSPNSDYALAHALKWAAECSSKVILFHAVEEIPPETHGRVDLFPEYNPYFEGQLAEAWDTIHQQLPPAASTKCEVSYEVRHGNAKEQILQVAAEHDVGLIVMGSRGVGGKNTVWGSTISGVVRDGRFPVLAVPYSSGKAI